MDKFALLGEKLSHSYSKLIHNRLGGYKYELIETQKEGLEGIIKNNEFNGFNVTVPYKNEVIKYCDVLDETAEKLQSVNTIFKTGGKIYGYNTDLYGFKAMLAYHGIDVKGNKVMILGGGASSKMVREVVGCQFSVVSRNGAVNYNNYQTHKDAEIIINTTPVGTYPNNLESLIDLSCFNNLYAAVDIIYNPARTMLLMSAAEKNIKTANGLYMLVAQAARAAEIFCGKKVSEKEINGIYRDIRNKNLNVILIGMPGSGKSAIGKLLSEKTGKPLIDTDAEIEKTEGKKIPEIFKEKGEEYFRKAESRAIAEAGKRQGGIIATGGGCVTKKENYYALKQNGIVFYVDRDLKLLELTGRPLSKDFNALEGLYKTRAPLYERFADYKISNNGDINAAAEEIVKITNYKLQITN